MDHSRQVLHIVAQKHIKYFCWLLSICDSKLDNTKCGIPLQGGNVDLDLWTHDPKSKGVSPLIIHNLHVKFESDSAKNIVCIVSILSYTQIATNDLWPNDPKSIGFLLSSSTTYMFESDWAKTVAAMVSTR